jgi:hypothetical protein
LANQEERASSSENTRKVVSGSALHLLNLKVLIFFSLLQTAKALRIILRCIQQRSLTIEKAAMNALRLRKFCKECLTSII